MIESIDHNLWIATSKFPVPKGFIPFAVPKVFGQCSIRMTIIRLGTGGLFIHSPIAPRKELLNEVLELGDIEEIVCPNVMHTAFSPDWAKFFPKATLHAPEKVTKREKRIVEFKPLMDTNPVSEEISQKYMQGHKNHETLFLHKRTKTLIATDLLYNLSGEFDLLESLFFRAVGVTRKPSLPFYHRHLTKDPFWAKIDELSSWDFDRVILSHGDVVHERGKDAFLAAWKKFRKSH